MTKEELAEEYVNSKGFGSDYNNIDSNEANEEIRKAYLNGLAKGLKWVLNRIPCKKNCSSCSRDGWLPCFEPDRFYIEDKLAKEIIQKYKEE